MFLPSFNKEYWMMPWLWMFWVIFKIRFLLFTTQVRISMRRCRHTPECKLESRQSRIMFEYSGWHSAQGKLGRFCLKSCGGYSSICMQALQKVMEMFPLTSVGVGVGLLLFSFFTWFLFQLLCSPAHLNQGRLNTVGRKMGKNNIF